MAFLNKVGNLVRQTASKHISVESSASRPSLFQAIRCMSSSKLFVGGISYNSDDTSLREAFSKYGEVIEARIIVDRETGRSRGFGFVTYTSSEEASSAIQALDGQDLHGRRIRVNYANDRARGGGYGGGGYGGGGYGGGDGYNSGFNSNYGGGGGYNNSGGGGYNSGGGGGYDNSGGGYNSGNTAAYGNSTDYGVAGGGGGNDNYRSNSFGGTYGSDQFNETSSAGYGNSTLGGGSDGLGYDGDQGGYDANAAGGYDKGESLESNYRDDDDDTGDFAKRA